LIVRLKGELAAAAQSRLGQAKAGEDSHDLFRRTASFHVLAGSRADGCKLGANFSKGGAILPCSKSALTK